MVKKLIVIFAPMFKNETLRKLSAALMVSVYLFVALGSAKFHHHSHGFSGKSGFEKQYTPSADWADAKDCLACHLFSIKAMSLPSSFEFKTLIFQGQSEEKTPYFQENHHQRKLISDSEARLR
ncbi:hypothetical protein [Bergeyella porcorum]|uniref:hypothetical protein n=1 Tax=Bergeyella porcorum TaxID=1735111 RepID=UPI002E1F74BE